MPSSSLDRAVRSSKFGVAAAVRSAAAEEDAFVFKQLKRLAESGPAPGAVRACLDACAASGASAWANSAGGVCRGAGVALTPKRRLVWAGRLAQLAVQDLRKPAPAHAAASELVRREVVSWAEQVCTCEETRAATAAAEAAAVWSLWPKNLLSKSSCGGADHPFGRPSPALAEISALM